MERSDQECLKAIKLALRDEWEDAHKIVQELKTSNAQWIHAVLHKIEGDEANSRYWYARSTIEVYESYSDSTQELKAIKKQIN
jgi:hypothetical protein|tara:strand:- start:2918 stop:3166 length:249 start_codon:yes stop_codon:yes gene_type:complete